MSNNNQNQNRKPSETEASVPGNQTYRVEVNPGRGRTYLWPPMQEKLRGRWSFAEMPLTDANEDISKLSRVAPVIPGLVIEVDLTASEVAILDPLEFDPDGRRILKEIRQVMKGFSVLSFHTDPWPARRWTVAKDDPVTLKNWMYHLVRGVISGKLLPESRSADIPTIAEVERMPGKFDVQPFSSKPMSQRLKAKVHS